MEKKKLSLKEVGIGKLVVILLCGIFLLALSFPQKDKGGGQEAELLPEQAEAGKSQAKDSVAEYEERMEERMEEILREVDGIGKVKVMITVKASKEKVTLKDAPYSEETIKENDSAGGTRESKTVSSQEATVLVDGSVEDSTPYVLKELEPEVEGVLVLAENGNQAALKTEIIEAVQVLFDVPPHKIKVMKMQEN